MTKITISFDNWQNFQNGVPSEIVAIEFENILIKAKKGEVEIAVAFDDKEMVLAYNSKTDSFDLTERNNS